MLKIRSVRQHPECGVCMKHKCLLRSLSAHINARQKQQEEYHRHLHSQYLDRLEYWSHRGRSRTGGHGSGQIRVSKTQGSQVERLQHVPKTPCACCWVPHARTRVALFCHKPRSPQGFKHPHRNRCSRPKLVRILWGVFARPLGDASMRQHGARVQEFRDVIIPCQFDYEGHLSKTTEVFTIFFFPLACWFQV